MDTELKKLLSCKTSDLSEDLRRTGDFTGDDFFLFFPRRRSVKKLPCLVAHIDTIDTHHKFDDRRIGKELYCDSEKKIVWSSGILGADDRAGVYACRKIWKRHNCLLLLTDGEESGGTGAREAEEIMLRKYGQDISFFVEIDRRGDGQMVFYCDEPESFREYVGSFGFEEHRGSFSDISILCRSSGICGVNLSAGFYNEHTRGEYLNVTHMENTIRKVSKLFSR